MLFFHTHLFLSLSIFIWKKNLKLVPRFHDFRFKTSKDCFNTFVIYGKKQNTDENVKGR